MKKLTFEFGLHPVGLDLGRRAKIVLARMGEAPMLRSITRTMNGALARRAAEESAPSISQGARFCPPDAPHVVWEVRSNFVGLDDVPYAELFCVSEPTFRKVVAAGALQDRTLFRAVPRDRDPTRQARRRPSIAGPGRNS